MLSDNLADMDLRAFGAMLREQLGPEAAAKVLDTWARAIGAKYGMSDEEQDRDFAEMAALRRMTPEQQRRYWAEKRATLSSSDKTRRVEADEPGGAA